MISREELATCLREAEFSEERIKRILKKRIKTVLEKGNADEIKKKLKVLKENGISQEAIENGLSVLILGKANQIIINRKIILV